MTSIVPDLECTRELLEQAFQNVMVVFKFVFFF